MSDDPLALGSWDVTRLYSDGHPDRAQQLARYLRERERDESTVDTPAGDWLRCPFCGGDEATVEQLDGDGVVFTCLRCSESKTYE